MTTEHAPVAPAPQRIIKVRRDYNTWVANETMEDYALRYTPQRARVWSAGRVANTALGVASFLVLEAVGATLMVQYGFWNAFWAVLVAGAVIFAAGVPVAYYAARYGVDMDLLTRGAGFGYIGSTITSLIYASFTFLFFALEAAVMAYALELALDVPPTWGYVVCAVVVIPLVTHGVSVISRFQVWTQPVWLVLMLVPYAAVWWLNPGAFADVTHRIGDASRDAGLDWHFFGAALTVALALITQLGEQADYLRFMPAARPGQRARWWCAVLAGGPGWVVPGVLKMLGGMLLAHLALSNSVSPDQAVDPNQMYLAAYEHLLPYGWAVALTAVFVVVSQLKINVTNAYAGSLAWSNFFSRLTHSHPGRVVWVVFNIAIALLLMEMNVFRALGEVLGVYAHIAIGWIMAVVADLVINKPMGWSPAGVEFKRAHLYDINPVGVGAMAGAAALGMAAHFGALGEAAQAFSAALSMATALVLSPLLAWSTGGRFYLARPQGTPAICPPVLQRCVVCERDYEAPDMAMCPAYQGTICSLCCTLDARCGDACKPHARLSVQWLGALQAVLPRAVRPYLAEGLAHYLLLLGGVAAVLAGVLAVLVQQAPAVLWPLYGPTYAALMLLAGTVCWWLVLMHKSREVAQEESRKQTWLLMQEIDAHRRTDEQLQQAKQAAEAANQAKTRYISTVSHELRTPLNSILGYAQLLQEDQHLGDHRAHALKVIHRGGEHLLSLIEGTLDIARIESGKLTLQPHPMAFADHVQEVAHLFELQAQAKGLRFVFDVPQPLPDVVKADAKRLRQILINLLGNAVKFTHRGEVRLRVIHAREMATFEVHDTGPGMAPHELERVFEPFARGQAPGVEAPMLHPHASGTGLGLTIAKMLTDLMGGELTVRSTVGVGTVFVVRLFLPVQHGTAPRQPVVPAVTGYAGPRLSVLVVDNEEADRDLLTNWLAPLGFGVVKATHGEDALRCLSGGLRPAAVFMDLAMPGIDGWETMRRMRAGGWHDIPVLVVSANAFDQGLDNDLGHTAQDFLVKPVRRVDLLGWLQRRLDLTWEQGSAPAFEPKTRAPAVAVAAPTQADTEGLLAAVRLGHAKGVVQWLDGWAQAHPEHAEWAQQMRALARAFRFEVLESRLTALP